MDLFQRLEEWRLSDENPILWLLGDAGTGKSTVASHYSRGLDEVGCLAGRFFFNDAEAGLDSDANLWTTLVSNLVDTYPPVQEHVYEALITHHNLIHDTLSKQLKHLFIDPLRKAQAAVPCRFPIIFVIAGIDECTPGARHRFFAALPEIAKIPNIKFLITAKPDTIFPHIGDIMTWLTQTDGKHETLEYNRADITEYLRTRIKAMSLDGLKGGVDDEKITTLADSLAFRSEGRFIWAEMACDWVGCTTAKEHELEQLATSPERITLDELYLRIIRQTSPANGDPSLDPILKAILQTLLIAPIPISTKTVVSLLEASAMDGLHTVSSSDVSERLEKLRSIFTVGDPSQPIRPKHASIRQFFLESGDHPFFLDGISAHRFLAESCLSLLMNTLQPDVIAVEPDCGNSAVESLKDRVEERVGDGLAYAAKCWPFHVERTLQGETSHSTQMLSLVKELFETKLLDWLELLSLLSEIPDSVARLAEVHEALEDSVRLSYFAALSNMNLTCFLTGGTIQVDGRDFTFHSIARGHHHQCRQ